MIEKAPRTDGAPPGAGQGARDRKAAAEIGAPCGAALPGVRLHCIHRHVLPSPNNSNTIPRSQRLAGARWYLACQNALIAMSGSFDALLDDGREQKHIHLNRSHYGLYVCPMIWRVLDNFSSNSVCMVLASDRYLEADYFRDYAEFVTGQQHA